MRPVGIVVIDVFAEDVAEMSSAGDDSTFAVLGLAGPFGLASEHALRGCGRVRGNRGIWGGCDTRCDLT